MHDNWKGPEKWCPSISDDYRNVIISDNPTGGEAALGPLVSAEASRRMYPGLLVRRGFRDRKPARYPKKIPGTPAWLFPARGGLSPSRA